MLDVCFDAVLNDRATQRALGHLLPAAPACAFVPAWHEYLHHQSLICQSLTSIANFWLTRLLGCRVRAALDLFCGATQPELHGEVFIQQ